MPTNPLQGPPLPLPGRLDRLADRWARMPPRVRLLVVVVLLVGFGAMQAGRLAQAQARWGGAGDRVWQATATTHAGGDVADFVAPVRLPAAALPPDAVTGPLPDRTVLALPLVEGTILTEVHLAAAGPAAGLPPDDRLLPIPIDRDAGIEAGSIVDVWAVEDAREDPEPIASGRSVLALREDGTRSVALVSVHEDDVAEATAVLARGRLLLTLRGS